MCLVFRMISRLYTFAFVPAVYSIEPNLSYSANFAEATGNTLLSIASIVRNVCQLTSPILLPYLIYRFPNPEQYIGGIKFIAAFYAAALLLRMIGRVGK